MNISTDPERNEKMEQEQLENQGVQDSTSADYDSGFDSIDDSGAAIIDAPGKEISETDEQNGDKLSTQTGEEQETVLDEDAVPDEFKNTHHYKSMFGRIEKERLEKEALKEKLRNYEATQKQSQQQTQRPSFERAEIPEDMKEDVAEFKRQYPEYADLVELKGREGDRIRSLLSGYGVDIAAVQAENIVNRIEVARSKQEVSQQVAQQIAISHEQQIYAAHPDFAELDPEKRLTFLDGIRDWIDEQPMKDARKWERVFNEGTTKETVALFSEFKKHLSNKNNTKQSNTRRQQAIDDGLAVKAGARTISHSSRKIDTGDYGGGWASIPD